MSLNLNIGGVHRYSTACGNSQLSESKAIDRCNCSYSRWILYRKAGDLILFSLIISIVLYSNVSIRFCLT